MKRERERERDSLDAIEDDTCIDGRNKEYDKSLPVQTHAHKRPIAETHPSLRR